MSIDKLASAAMPASLLGLVVVSLLAVWLLVRIVLENLPPVTYWVALPCAVLTVLGTLAVYRDDAPTACFVVACITGVAVILETIGIQDH